MSDIIGHNEPLQIIICNDCKNFIKGEGLKCKAFERIPNEIISGINDHSKPLTNQVNNVVFEPVKNPRWYKPKN